MVEVTQNGIIFLQDCFIYTTREEDKVALAVAFTNERDAQAFYNLLKASLDVGCIHIHTNAKHIENAVFN